MTTCPSCENEVEVRYGLCSFCGEEIKVKEEAEVDSDVFDEDEEDIDALLESEVN